MVRRAEARDNSIPVVFYRYSENYDTPFYLPEELKKYCQNDTEILMKAIVKFRHILMAEITNGFDVLPISCTIARLQSIFCFCFKHNIQCVYEYIPGTIHD